MTFVTGVPLTAAQLNTHLRDNLNYLRSSATAVVATQQSTTSATYTDLATAGPAVTITTDTQALVLLFCGQMNPAINSSMAMSFAVSGATTIGATDTQAQTLQIAGSGVNIGGGIPILVTGLTPGSHTFTSKYRSDGTASNAFKDRRITVIPS